MRPYCEPTVWAYGVCPWVCAFWNTFRIVDDPTHSAALYFCSLDRRVQTRSVQLTARSVASEQRAQTAAALAERLQAKRDAQRAELERIEAAARAIRQRNKLLADDKVCRLLRGKPGFLVPLGGATAVCDVSAMRFC